MMDEDTEIQNERNRLEQWAKTNQMNTKSQNLSIERDLKGQTQDISEQ